MLTADNVILVVVDVQDKLSRIMHEKEKFLRNLQTLIKGVQVLGIPILLTEENPAGLGSTVPEVAQLFTKFQAIPRFSFSCCGEERFRQELQALNRKQVLLSGIETQVCIYQTAMDLLAAGYEVQVISDAVSSRAKENKDIALERMRDEGVKLSSVEMVLFELIKVAQGPKFKEMLKIVK